MSTTQSARKKFTMSVAQENLYSGSLANVVCKVDTNKMGTVYNPYTSKPAVANGTVSGATYPVASYKADADSLQVNQRATASEHVDSYDWKSVDFGLLEDRGMNMGKAITQRIDGEVFNVPVGLSGVLQLDDGDFGGTDGNPKTTSNSNMDDVITGSLVELEVNNAHSERKFLLVSPYEAKDLKGYLMDTGNNVADEIIRNGIPSKVRSVGTTISGVDVYVTNNLTQTAVLGLATNPTDGDTITFAGVTYTFVATLSGAAGEVHIASTVDITRANLAEAITGTTFPGDTAEAEATDTGYSALSAEDQYKLAQLGVTATNDNTGNTLTITAKGTFRVAETLTDGTDTWGTPYRYLIMGDYGSISLYLPSKGMDYTEKEVSGKAGVELYMEQFHNETVWTRMRDRVLTIKVN